MGTVAYMSPEQALRLMEEIRASGEADGNLRNLLLFGVTLALAGKREDAFEIIEKMRALGDKTKVDISYSLAAVFAALGDEDEAFVLLEGVCEKRLPAAIALRCEPFFHCLHGDPRFEELVKKIGFPAIPGTKKGATPL